MALPTAVGFLELMWHWTARFAPPGDIGRWSDAEIAGALRWEGEPAVLIGALLDSRFLDHDFNHRLIVHHWSEHADDAIHIALARRLETFADGTRPSTRRLSSKERETLEKRFRAHKSAQKRTKARSGALPEPEPEPLPLVRTAPPPPAGGLASVVPSNEPANPPPAPPPRAGGNGRTAPDRQGAPGEIQAVREEVAGLEVEVSKLTRIPVDILRTRTSRTPSGAVIVNLDGCDRLPWLITTRDKLLEMKLSAQADAHDRQLAAEPPPPPGITDWIVEQGGLETTARAIAEHLRAREAELQANADTSAQATTRVDFVARSTARVEMIRAWARERGAPADAAGVIEILGPRIRQAESDLAEEPQPP